MSRLVRQLTASFAAPAACALTVLLAACGGGDKVSGPGNNNGTFGSFSGAATGGVSKNIAGGVAFYGQLTAQQGGGETAFQLGMGTRDASGDFKDLVVIGRENMALPAAGQYALHTLDTEDEVPADKFVLVAAIQGADGAEYFCGATSGTLSITTSANKRVKGSYTAQVSCANMDDLLDEDAEEVAATLTGSFDAVEGSGVTVPGNFSVRFAAARAAR